MMKCTRTAACRCEECVAAMNMFSSKDLMKVASSKVFNDDDDDLEKDKKLFMNKKEEDEEEATAAAAAATASVNKNSSPEINHAIPPVKTNATNISNSPLSEKTKTLNIMEQEENEKVVVDKVPEKQIQEQNENENVVASSNRLVPNAKEEVTAEQVVEEIEVVEDFSKLPLQTRLSHTNWKARRSGYEEIQLLGSATPLLDPNFHEKYIKTVENFLSETNAGALDTALDAAISFIKSEPYGFAKTLISTSSADGSSLDRASTWIPLLFKTAFPGRPGTLKRAQELVMLLFEVESSSSVCSSLIKGLNDKNPKVPVSCMSCFGELVSSFSPGVVPMNSVLDALVLGLNSKSVPLKTQSQSVALELRSWIGEGFDSILLSKLDASTPIAKSIQKALSAAASSPPKTATRFLRSANLKKKETNVGGNQESSSSSLISSQANSGINKPPMMDPFDFIEAREILSKIENMHLEKRLAEPKWTARNEALTELEEMCGKPPKLVDGDYTNLISILKAVVKRDSHQAVVIHAISLFGVLACGLRRKFSHQAKHLVPILVDKLRDRKAPFVQAACNAMHDFFKYCCSLCDEKIVTSFREGCTGENSTPIQRLNLASFVTKQVTIGQCWSLPTFTTIIQEELPYFQQLVALISEFNSDADVKVRDAASSCLAALYEHSPKILECKQILANSMSELQKKNHRAYLKVLELAPSMSSSQLQPQSTIPAVNLNVLPTAAATVKSITTTKDNNSNNNNNNKGSAAAQSIPTAMKQIQIAVSIAAEEEEEKSKVLSKLQRSDISNLIPGLLGQISDLKSKDAWRVRQSGLEDLSTLLESRSRYIDGGPEVRVLVTELSKRLEDHNRNVAAKAISVLGLVGQSLGGDLASPMICLFAERLLKSFSDKKPSVVSSSVEALDCWILHRPSLQDTTPLPRVHRGCLNSLLPYLVTPLGNQAMDRALILKSLLNYFQSFLEPQRLTRDLEELEKQSLAALAKSLISCYQARDPVTRRVTSDIVALICKRLGIDQGEAMFKVYLRDSPPAIERSVLPLLKASIDQARLLQASTGTENSREQQQQQSFTLIPEPIKTKPTILHSSPTKVLRIDKQEEEKEISIRNNNNNNLEYQPHFETSNNLHHRPIQVANTKLNISTTSSTNSSTSNHNPNPYVYQQNILASHASSTLTEDASYAHKLIQCAVEDVQAYADILEENVSSQEMNRKEALIKERAEYTLSLIGSKSVPAVYTPYFESYFDWRRFLEDKLDVDNLLSVVLRLIQSIKSVSTGETRRVLRICFDCIAMIVSHPTFRVQISSSAVSDCLVNFLEMESVIDLSRINREGIIQFIAIQLSEHRIWLPTLFHRLALCLSIEDESTVDSCFAILRSYIATQETQDEPYWSVDMAAVVHALDRFLQDVPQGKHDALEELLSAWVSHPSLWEDLKNACDMRGDQALQEIIAHMTEQHREIIEQSGMNQSVAILAPTTAEMMMVKPRITAAPRKSSLGFDYSYIAPANDSEITPVSKFQQTKVSLADGASRMIASSSQQQVGGEISVRERLQRIRDQLSQINEHN